MGILNEKYLIKWGTELAWAVTVAVLVYAAQIVTATDFDAVQDWPAYAWAIVGGAGRVAIAIVVNSIRQLLGRAET